eukprot:4447869-Heterocapsa_arctica.AAC.1
MDGGAALHAKPEALTSTRNIVLHIRTKDGKTRTVIIRITTAMDNTLDTRPGRKLIAEWLKSTRIKSFRNEKTLRLSEKERTERWIKIVIIKTWTKCTDMCIK